MSKIKFAEGRRALRAASRDKASRTERKREKELEENPPLNLAEILAPLLLLLLLQPRQIFARPANARVSLPILPSSLSLLLLLLLLLSYLGRDGENSATWQAFRRENRPVFGNARARKFYEIYGWFSAPRRGIVIYADGRTERPFG